MYGNHVTNRCQFYQGLPNNISFISVGSPVAVDVGTVLVNKLVHALLADLPAVGVDVDCQAASESCGVTQISSN